MLVDARAGIAQLPGLADFLLDFRDEGTQVRPRRGEVILGLLHRHELRIGLLDGHARRAQSVNKSALLARRAAQQLPCLVDGRLSLLDLLFRDLRVVLDGGQQFRVHAGLEIFQDRLSPRNAAAQRHGHLHELVRVLRRVDELLAQLFKPIGLLVQILIGRAATGDDVDQQRALFILGAD